MTAVVDLPPLPAVVSGHVAHARLHPLRHAFRHRHYQWLIDVDEPPRVPAWLRPAATIRPQDHLDGPDTWSSLRRAVDATLARHGVPAEQVARVVLFTHARVAGHVFDPMSAYWCLDADGGLLAVLVEVHNTYGGRHAYVVRPDERGRASVEKTFYVSPFNDVEGRYDLRFRLRPDRVGVAVRLVMGERTVLSATVDGRPRAATTPAVLATVLRHPAMPQRVSALIRMHGVRLWMRRLPVVPRPSPSPESIR